jgi:hypothetical protein
LRVNGNGYRMGLNLVIDTNVEDYSVTTGIFDGFKVLKIDQLILKMNLSYIENLLFRF